MHNDSTKKTLAVAIGVCVVCSVVVSSAAVLLRPLQEANRIASIQKNIVKAAGLYTEENNDVATLFSQLETRVVDLDTGEYVTDVDPEKFDAVKAAKDPKTSEVIPKNEDIARIRRRAKLGLIYIKPDAQGEIERIILPVYGKGLWSTMYGFITLDKDFDTIKSFGFYQHGETPGLGGEIDAQWWKDSWVDKLAFDDEGKPAIKVLKGAVNPDDPNAQYEVDGIGGATLTCQGVERLVHYWLSQEGYGPLLTRLKAGAKEEGDNNG